MRALILSCLVASGLGARAAESLLPDGNFEQADPANPAQPAHWQKPDGLGAQWTNAPGAAHGRAIRLDTAVTEKAMVASWTRAGLTQWIFPNPADNPISDTYGLSFYSEAIPVQAGQPYKITFDYRGPSGGAKVWVRGWGLFQGEKRRRWETAVECRVAHPGEWTTITQEFFPTKSRPEVTEMKVMLFAYHPPGVYWFDNVRIKPITGAEYDALRKTPAPAAHGRNRPAP